MRRQRSVRSVPLTPPHYSFHPLIRALAIRPHWRRWEVEYLARPRRRMVACSTQFWQRAPRAVINSRGPAMAIPLHMVIRSRERRSQLGVLVNGCSFPTRAVSSATRHQARAPRQQAQLCSNSKSMRPRGRSSRILFVMPPVSIAGRMISAANQKTPSVSSHVSTSSIGRETK